jgi:hypothetical protein
LVVLNADTCPERGLQQGRVRGRDAVPAERVYVCGKQRGIVEFARAEAVPAVRFVCAGIRLNIPRNIESLPLRVILTQARLTRALSPGSTGGRTFSTR